MPMTLHSVNTLSGSASSEFRQCNCNERYSLKYNKPLLLMDKYRIVDQKSLIIVIIATTFLTLVLIICTVEQSVIPIYSPTYKDSYEKWKVLLIHDEVEQS